MCKAKGKIGTRGRLCGEFDVEVSLGAGCVAKCTPENLDEILDELEELYETDKVEILLRRIGAGICLKAYPMKRRVGQAVRVLNWCMGGANGMDLLHLPYDGGIYDQPAYFMQAYEIIVQEKSNYLKEQYAEKEDPGADPAT